MSNLKAKASHRLGGRTISRRANVTGASRFETLETRQLLSGVPMSTAAGYIVPSGIAPRAAVRAPVSSAPAVTSTSPSVTATPAATTPPALFPGATYHPAGSGDYATGRTSTGWIVIHTTESTASSTINEFTTDGLQVSANYMVERNGTIDQFVSNLDTAYHSGNSAYNHASIGIEHERYTGSGATITEQEYEASANLVRWIGSYYTSIPLQHYADGLTGTASVAPASPTSGSDIIGHYQVPNPSDPTKGGGANGHTDPVNWDWGHYISLINSTTTPLMPVLIGPGSITTGATTVNSVSQTLKWMPVTYATSYQVVVKDTTANTTNTYTVAGTASSLALTFVNGHNYTWSATSFINTTQSIASPIYAFNVTVAAPITDATKQSLMLGMVNTYRGSVLPETVLAGIMQEGGQGAFYVDGSTKNSFYSSSVTPWGQPTNNADGIMQVTTASGYSTHRPYATTQQGYDDAINDGTADLKAGLAQYGTQWQASLHYNTGPNSLYIYKNNQGDKTYLGHIATDLGVVQTLYGIKDPALVSKYNAAQAVVNNFLNNTTILSGQAVSYYASYQTQLDAQLRALGAADDAPATPTNVSPLTATTGTAVTLTLTGSTYSDPNAGDTQSAAEWVIRRVSDGSLVYDSGTDTTHLTSLAVPAGVLATGTRYSWTVRYADTEGTWSATSNATTFTTVDQPPAIQSFSLSPSPVTQGFSLTATPSGVSDADGTVTSVQYYAETNGVSGYQAGSDRAVGSGSPSGYVGTIDTTNLPVGSQVIYAVPVDNLNFSGTAVPATVTINPAVTSLTATATSGTTAHVSWSGAPASTTSFTLERSTAGGAYVQVATPAAGSTSFDDAGLSPATAYTYRLRVSSGASTSTYAYSNASTTWKSGDANGDGVADSSDFLILQSHFGAAGTWLQGDFDGNGVVNFSDFLILQNAMS